MEDPPAAPAISAIAPAAPSEAEGAEIEVQANPMTTPSTHHTIGCGGRVLQSPGDGARPTGHPTPAAPIRTTPVLRQNAPRGVLPPAVFSSTGRGAFSFVRTKENGGAYPRRGDPCTGRTLPAPAKNHHTCPSKSPQNRQNVPLTGTHRRGIVSSNLKKGIEKDADRERQQRGAAVGCKRLLPITGAQPPPWSRPPICRLGRDLPLQRTRAACRQARKQGGTVEYVFVSHP